MFVEFQQYANCVPQKLIKFSMVELQLLVMKCAAASVGMHECLGCYKPRHSHIDVHNHTGSMHLLTLCVIFTF